MEAHKSIPQTGIFLWNFPSFPTKNDLIRLIVIKSTLIIKMIIKND